MLKLQSVKNLLLKVLVLMSENSSVAAIRGQYVFFLIVTKIILLQVLFSENRHNGSAAVK